MNKIDLIIVDYKNMKEEDIPSLSFLNEEDLSSISKIKLEKVKIEKAISTAIKNKYIKDYYLSNKGKPLSNNIYFNISHSGSKLVLALDKSHPVGVDIEEIKDHKIDLKDKVCSDIEKQYVKDYKSFLEIWTNKESLIKCIGGTIFKSIKSITSLPINGRKIYEDKIYYSKTIEIDNYILSVTIKNSDEFDLNIINIDPSSL